MSALAVNDRSFAEWSTKGERDDPFGSRASKAVRWSADLAGDEPNPYVERVLSQFGAEEAVARLWIMHGEALVISW